MNILLSLTLITLIALCYFYFKLIKGRKKLHRSRSDILAWMDMTRAERHALDEEDKKISTERKKRLLEQIRKEYSALSNKKNNKKKEKN